jgi:predicted nucleotidyltransferase
MGGMAVTLHDIEQAVERLVDAASSPRLVILFGSRAEGRERVDSDVDLLVVEDAVLDPAQEYRRLRQALHGLDAGVDLLLYGAEEFERRRHWWSSPVHDAVHRGRVLYERVDRGPLLEGPAKLARERW